TIYSYDKKVIKKKTIKYIRSVLYVPSSLKVGTVTYPSFNQCKVYYSAYNRYGERIYSATTGYFIKGEFYIYNNF
ncbi:MAG: hypothetical protein IJ725_02195, partial [Ruminococcus sp.]|nr:hypothetical protein [Ruminococcus sp.]